ncbi:18699_t:CDS:1 [Dentiscutata erythropus]|uniref:18699_t:CDS:1 n=1 Tax=Dentiscutata erythropus TaxID=1348616 RepID=A0A9N9F5E4_9GLOM|nr:18699_t:CDS:1 [Dentiscutata erythropus]
MSKTENLYTKLPKTDDSRKMPRSENPFKTTEADGSCSRNLPKTKVNRKYYNTCCMVSGDHMDNPWEYVRQDLWFLICHWFDIIKFLLDNSIFGFCFNSSKTLKGGADELDLSHLANWRSIFFQLWCFCNTIPSILLYPIREMQLKEEECREPLIDVEEHEDERWFFINGVMVNRHWLDENCRRLERRFNRGVTGILNSSYGIIWDTAETILSRSFDDETIPVRWASWNIFQALKDDSIKKVRLIAHSEGCVIANLVIKKLYWELSYSEKDEYDESLLNKLEVYTFANISREFINPKGLISCIEHYANEEDFISKMGVLHEVKNPRFHGKIFVNKNAKGHLFNRYYSLNPQDYVFYKRPDECHISECEKGENAQKPMFLHL